MKVIKHGGCPVRPACPMQKIKVKQRNVFIHASIKQLENKSVKDFGGMELFDERRCGPTGYKFNEQKREELRLWP